VEQSSDEAGIDLSERRTTLVDVTTARKQQQQQQLKYKLTPTTSTHQWLAIDAFRTS